VFVGGRNAVQLFYMISGFYISYILVERKTYPDVTSFYINRYLRLYPIYFAVAFLTLITFGISSALSKDIDLFLAYDAAPLSANLLLVFSNATLFFQDWVMFLGVENNRLVFTTDFNKSEIVLHRALLVPQAWTLGVELTFYLVAPFVLSRQWLLMSLLVLSIAARIYLVYIGLGRNDPWTYRFFPTELALFLLGALAHQVLLPLYKARFPTERLDTYADLSTSALIIITLAFSLLPTEESFNTIALFLIFLILMPFAFIFQSKREWDQRVGELSYPIYTCHVFVLYVVRFSLKQLGFTDKVSISLCVVVASICLSLILNRYIGRPIESLRDRFRKYA